jgi:hypothetical protein
MLCLICALVILIAFCGNVSAKKIGDVVMDLTANDCTADATDIADFQWSRTSDGTSITITVDCELDDNLVQVNFNFLAVINALQNDSFGNYKDQKSDEWHNPSAPNTDNSVVWPLGQFAFDTLTVTFNSLAVGDTIDCHVGVDIRNTNPNPDEDAHDETWTRITIIA